VAVVELREPSHHEGLGVASLDRDVRFLGCLYSFEVGEDPKHPEGGSFEEDRAGGGGNPDAHVAGVVDFPEPVRHE
jgi:hypothetical protein